MEKQVVTEEMHPEKEWFKQAREIKTIEELTAFVDKMLNGYSHDYVTVCHAIAACSVASAWLGAHMEGITGFQMPFVMWGFIEHWFKEGNKCGLRLVDYDDFLYPQYEYRHDKVMGKGTWECLQKEAACRLVDRCDPDDPSKVIPEVEQHWQSIVNGVVPFGYSVIEDL